MNAPTPTPQADLRKPVTLWDRSKLSGAQATLSLAALHVVTHSTRAQASGESWDRHMLEIALRDAREALDEVEAVFAAALATAPGREAA